MLLENFTQLSLNNKYIKFDSGSLYMSSNCDLSKKNYESMERYEHVVLNFKCFNVVCVCVEMWYLMM